MYYIYEITNNIDCKTYIGQRKCPENKLPETDKYMGSGVILKQAYKKHGKENFIKTILAIAETQENINILEKVFIALYREIGKAEYNVADGGQIRFSGEIAERIKEKISESGKGKHKNSEETLEKIVKAHKGIPMSEEQKKKIGNANRGKKRTLEQKKRISESLKGRKLTEEQKRKISESNKGRVHTKETKEKLRQINLGRKHTEETKNKMSEIGKLRVGEKAGMYGKHHSEETKEKLRQANLGKRGRKHSEETKRKISESHKGRVFSEEHKRKLKEAQRKRWSKNEF